MSYEIKKLESHVVSVSFNGDKPYLQFPVPRQENGDYDIAELNNILQFVDTQRSAVASNTNELEALVVTETQSNEECASCARKKRNLFLQLTDYTQMPDSPLSSEDKDALAIVRQELRDISSQAGFPTDIQWPEIPTMDAAERQRIIDTDFCGG